MLSAWTHSKSLQAFEHVITDSYDLWIHLLDLWNICSHLLLYSPSATSAVLLIIALFWPPAHESLTTLRSNFLPIAPPRPPFHRANSVVLPHQQRFGCYSPVRKHMFNGTVPAGPRSNFFCGLGNLLTNLYQTRLWNKTTGWWSSPLTSN